MTDNKHILYLVWGENIIQNGILQNQVMNFVNRINKEENFKVSLLIGIPYLNYLLKGVSRQKIKESRSPYNGKNVLFRNILLPFKFYLPPFLIPFIILPYTFSLALKIRKLRVDIIHCRSYPSATLAHLTNIIFRLNKKIVFDTRGLYNEEAVMRAKFKRNGTSYKLWQKIERFLLNRSDAITTVSETFTEIILSRTDNNNVYTIPTTINREIFKKYDSPERAALKNHLSLTFPTLVYLGGLDNSGWYSLERMLWIYSIIKSKYSKATFLIVTNTERALIQDKINDSPDLAGDIKIVTSKSAEETVKYLNACDVGIAAFHRDRSKIEQIIDYTVIASKTGEYLAAGLPIIYDQKIGAAAKLINKEHLGFTFSDHESEEQVLNSFNSILENYEKISDRCVRNSMIFDIGYLTSKYIKMYRSL